MKLKNFNKFMLFTIITISFIAYSCAGMKGIDKDLFIESLEKNLEINPSEVYKVAYCGYGKYQYVELKNRSIVREERLVVYKENIQKFPDCIKLIYQSQNLCKIAVTTNELLIFSMGDKEYYYPNTVNFNDIDSIALTYHPWDALGEVTTGPQIQIILDEKNAISLNLQVAYNYWPYGKTLIRRDLNKPIFNFIKERGVKEFNSCGTVGRKLTKGEILLEILGGLGTGAGPFN